MTQITPKLSWQDRVKAIDEYHKSMLRGNDKWRISDTAAELNRAEGSVAEDLMLASWFKTYPRLEKMRTAREALEFIRARKKEMRLGL